MTSDHKLSGQEYQQKTTNKHLFFGYARGWGGDTLGLCLNIIDGCRIKNYVQFASN